MSIIKSIRKIEPDYAYYEATLDTYGSIIFNGKYYAASAKVREGEEGFASIKVGKKLVKYRLQLQIIDNEIKRVETIAKIKRQMYMEAMGYGTRYIAEVDPTSVFYHNVSKAEAQVTKLRTFKKSLQKEYKDYLNGIDRVVQSVNRQRNKDKIIQSN